MMLAEMTAQDAAIIIGACGAFVVAILAPMLKTLSDIRKQTAETNVGINNRPKSDGTLRDVVDEISARVGRLEEKTDTHHAANTTRIDRATVAIEAQTRKMDRLASAIAGTNDRINHIEEKRQNEQHRDKD